MYNDNRCYVYNKAFAEWFKTPELWGDDIPEENIVNVVKPHLTDSDMFDNIRDMGSSKRFI